MAAYFHMFNGEQSEAQIILEGLSSENQNIMSALGWLKIFDKRPDSIKEALTIFHETLKQDTNNDVRYLEALMG